MLFLLLACGEKPDIEVMAKIHVQETAEPTPKAKIGQFFPNQNGTGQMLATKSKPSTCSQYIEPAEELEVYTEMSGYILEARKNTVNDSLRLGPTLVIPFQEAKSPLIGKRGGYLTFAVTHRIDHMITDEMEFQKCCMENEDACKGYYISSYLKGTGMYSKFRKKKVFFDQIDLSPYILANDLVEGTAEEWSVRTPFKQTDYYLFEVTPMNLCYEWLSTGVPAKTLDRKYFAGHAEIREEENISARKSYANASKQAKVAACQAAAKHIKLDKKGKPITCEDVPNIVFQCEEKIDSSEGNSSAGVLMYILMSDLPEE